MPQDKDDQEEPDELIAKANRSLARLQRDRARLLLHACLPAYNMWTTKLESERLTSAVSMDAALFQLLSGSSDEDAFVDSEKADELAWSVEAIATQVRLHRKLVRREFDVFLCHNTEDKREVRSLGEQLRRRGLLPWLDEQELRPGMAWLQKLQEDFPKIKSSAIIVGQHGIGPWQNQEVGAILQLFVEHSRPIIPVILPSCQSVPDLPLFLRNLTWVDYRTLDPDPLDQLVWGVKGRRSVG